MVKWLLTLVFCIGMIPEQLAAAQPTKTIQVRIAEGKTISATVDERGPFPAEDATVKVEVAGILVRFREDRKEPQLVWNFSFRAKVSQPITRVRIDDVTEDPVVGLIGDNQPTLKGNLWSGTAQPIAISKETIPWLYDSKPLIKVFRLTVQYDDGSEAILHQLSWYPASFKDTVRAHADKLRAGG